MIRLLTRRLRRADLIALDAALAVVLVAICWYAASERPMSGGPAEPGWLSALAGLLVGGPLAARRRWPVAVAVAVCAAGNLTVLTGIVPDYASGGPALAIAAALYVTGVAVPPRRSVAVLAGCLTATVATLIAADSTGAVTDIGFFCLVVAGAWLLGWLVRERRAYAAQAAEEFAQRAVTDERLRIAREMHDIVAHSMSLIAVKAAVGNHVAEASPAQAREALAVIEATSRGALVEMRRALGVLRQDAEYAPAPGLAELKALAERAAAGGVDVELDVDKRAELPEAVGLSVFRIVQEALTNVVKHAAPARCRVAVTVHSGEVSIEVTDEGGLVQPVPAGHGLIGIRERVTMYGGEFTAGPRLEGGFRVKARLPYGSVA
ncbi:sensor histidine kinase [Micromonospora sp. CPCC 206061]|uniref:sensor histidine kinase n=1 Tax=Micromonospora sp. CPCC 206061 TaxID=3122410 RepID=UPI002FF3808B